MWKPLMIFVPLPLFAFGFLLFLLARFVLAQDMRLPAHRLFAALIAGYAVQALLTALRWGYHVDAAGRIAGFLAPVLPVLALLAMHSLQGRLRAVHLWPLAVICLVWAVLLMAPLQADPLILVMYVGFGALICLRAWQGPDAFGLSPLGSARQTARALVLIGAALIASGLADIYVIHDFIRNEGRNAGLVLSLAQTGFVLAIGTAAAFGQAASQPDEPAAPRREATQTDAQIVASLRALFEAERLHLNEDISLRRLSRRLGLPDRHVSGAINRAEGISVSQFVNAHRIDEACTLLRGTDRTILEISLASGFASKSNFNREFVRVTGKTPSAWRKG